jgi:TPR repeat protein
MVAAAGLHRCRVRPFEKAAANGHAGAMFTLGALHAGGHGMPTNRQLAQQWFRAAAELGHGQAQMMLGRYLTSVAARDCDDQEARLWLERASQTRSPILRRCARERESRYLLRTDLNERDTASLELRYGTQRHEARFVLVAERLIKKRGVPGARS